MLSRIFFSSLFLFVAISAAPGVIKDAAEANKYLEDVLTRVNELIVQDGLDPYDAIDYSFLNVHLNGSVLGLSSLHRVSDAKRTVSSDGKLIEVEAIIGLTSFTTKLDWSVQLGFIPLKGKVTSTADKVEIKVRFRVNTDTKIVTITLFKVTALGNIKTEVDSSPIPFVDKITGLVTSAVANMSKNFVVKLFESNIKDIVEDTLNHFAVEGIPFK